MESKYYCNTCKEATEEKGRDGCCCGVTLFFIATAILITFLLGDPIVLLYLIGLMIIPWYFIIFLMGLSGRTYKCGKCCKKY